MDCADIFLVLEKSDTSSHNPGLTQAETDLALEVFRYLCGRVENTHLSTKELASCCAQSYYRANKLIKKMKRFGKQVGADEFLLFFSTMPARDRQQLQMLVRTPAPIPEDGTGSGVTAPVVVVLPPDGNIQPNPTERSHSTQPAARNGKLPDCCVVV